MDKPQQNRQLIYLGSSKKDAEKLPHEVKELFVAALKMALIGKHMKMQNRSNIMGVGYLKLLQIIEEILFGKYILCVIKKLFLLSTFFKKRANMEYEHQKKMWN